MIFLLIDPSIKEGDWYYAWKLFARHLVNGNYKIQGIDSYLSYNTVAHADSFRTNISIADMNILTARIFGVSNDFNNKNVPIHKIFCFGPPPYYMDWFENITPMILSINTTVRFVFN